MESKEDPNADGHRHNTATENSDTIARQKKRARRVSFAEMTSVHFFDRDEELNETPSTGTAKIGDDSAGELGSGGESERSKGFGGEDDGDDNVDDEMMQMRSSFLRPVGSPSPGGSTFGSASSNDEDNFFGPVSANFIRPGRLLDSAASDDNHDVTMDSTAFSMHYRSLALSDSGVDLKTPTGGQLFFEEKTPTNANIGSSMVFTLGKKPIPKSCMPVTEVNDSHNSNDMSLVGENPNKYNYDKLSPGLDALLAESSKNLLSVSISDDVITSASPKRKESLVLPSVDHGVDLVNPSDCIRKEISGINSRNVLNGEESTPCRVFGEANGPHRTFHSGLSPKTFSSSTLGAAASNTDNYKPNMSPDQLSKDESETALVLFTSSPVKQPQLLLTTASPSQLLGATSPLLAKPVFLLRNDSVEHHETQTSIQKSISKLELLEKSGFSSSFSAKVDNSTIKSLDFLKSPNFDAFLEKKRHISRMNFEDSVTEKKLASVDQSKERSYAFSMNRTRAETLNHISGENHLEEHLDQIMSGKLPNELSAKNLSADQSKYKRASPSKIWSGNKLMRSLFSPKHSNEDAVMTETESLLADIASGDGVKILSAQFVSSPGRLLEKKLSTTLGLQSSQSKDLVLQSQFKQSSDSDKDRDSTPEGNLTDGNLSTSNANRAAVSNGMDGELGSPFVEVNHLKNLVEVRSTDNGEVDIYNRNGTFGNIDDFITPAKNKYQVKHSKILDVGNQTSRESSRFEDDLPGGEFGVISHGSVSPSAYKNLEEPTLQKNLRGFPTAIPSRKEIGNTQSPIIPSPRTIQLSGRLEKFSGNKRSIELLLRDTQHRTEMAIMQRSPKLQKGGNVDTERQLSPNEGRSTLSGNERKKWTDIYSTFSEDMKKIISASADKLNNKMIDVLGDIFIHQQRSKIYEMLHLGVMPQNAVVLHDPQLGKIAEVNSLLLRVVYEKAKLQLKNVQREKLLKRLQILSSSAQESLILRENILSNPLGTHSTNVLVDGVGDRSLSVSLKDGHEVCHEKLTAMRHALEALDRKILTLKGTFHACCKLKAEQSCDDTIALVNEQLIKRASCRFIRLDMQMWVVHSVGSVNGQHNIVLNYLDFIFQSIKVIVGPTSSAATSFKLNEANIIKNFPNLDACTAFTFVFNAERARKYVGAKTLVQETQVTSSLLGTLLDVVEEVQLAQMELQNLTQSNFSSPSDGQLNLMLSYFNFNSGRKVILTLDMSCLKRGIYPSDVLPLQLPEPVNSQKCLLSGRTIDEISDAVKGVRSGYMRILRLCRCISQVI
ncbi:uncharacterized protein LOC105178718 isoform X2 [Sesamum indicum]|uniref:Uncharacterized protein LOC105178718 isoform X2 n=1 Tax=Sesamum indicum TaxID=4182 RepID=A0A8M8VER2_SESIN|nr:uncharacterized protein LOC105178718 isoform X2 [Sesamum indicum]